MDLRLDDDQAALQDAVTRWCADRWPLTTVAERDEAFDAAAWAEVVELGLPTLLRPAAHDGLGLGAVEAAAVLEPLGAHLVPGPVLWATLAGAVLGEAAPDLLPADAVVTGVVDDGTRPVLVEHATHAVAVLVLRADDVRVVDTATLELDAAGEPLDPFTPVSVVRALPDGTPVATGAAAVRARRLGTVCAAALQLGVAQAALDVAVAYSLEREQFGVPIGSFQALQHLMADMYVRVGLARSATYAAAAMIDDPEGHAVDRGVGSAKLLAGEGALENARAAVQVLGGMGFTWDMAPNFLLKRAWLLDQTFGTTTEHALAVAASVADELDAEAAA